MPQVMRHFNWRRAIAGWQVIGGAWALLIILERGAMIRDGGASMPLIAVLVALAGFTVLAGCALLRGWAEGRTLSMIALAGQCFAFNVGFAAWNLVLGPYALAGWAPGVGISFATGVTARGSIAIGQTTGPPYFAFNVLAIISFLFLAGQPDTTAEPANAASIPSDGPSVDEPAI